MESIELVEWVFIAFSAMVLILLNGLGKVMLELRNDIKEIKDQLGGPDSYVQEIKDTLDRLYIG